MVHPTVGRIVWYQPVAENPYLSRYRPPFAAIITYVLAEDRVNILVLNPDGTTEREEGVLLVQDDPPPELEQYVEWMPTQKTQSARLRAEVTHDSLRERGAG
jgi:hypothetical protein